MQEQILEQHPSADLQVYAIWLPMLSTDDRSEWTQALLPDPRVAHFWDEERVSGLWFAEADTAGLGYAGIVWDTYFLFDRGASWDDVPAPVILAGAPVNAHVDALARSVRRLLRDSAEPEG